MTTIRDAAGNYYYLASISNEISNLAEAIKPEMTALINSTKGVLNPAGLTTWQNALAGHATSPAKLLTIGDSITEGCLTSTFASSWPMALQSILRGKKGIVGGYGYAPSTPTDGAMVPGPPNTREGTEVMGGWGIGGQTIQLHGATHHVTYASRACDRIRVWYGKTDTLGGSLKVAIDDVDQGVSLSSVGTGSPAVNSDGHYWDSPVLTPGNHIVKITSANDFIGILDGVEFYNGDYGSGIHVYNAGHFGYTTASFLTSNMNMAFQQAGVINPQGVVIFLGANDLISTTAVNYLAGIDSIKAKFPNASILLLAGYLRGDEQARGAQWNEMMTGLKFRATGNVSVLDLAPYWPVVPATNPTTTGLMSDTVHPNTAGMGVIAQLVADVLTGPVVRR